MFVHNCMLEPARPVSVAFQVQFAHAACMLSVRPQTVMSLRYFVCLPACLETPAAAEMQQASACIVICHV